jgi:hypothetical protein
MRRRMAAVWVALAALGPAAAHAQGRIAFTIGGGVAGAASLGRRDATLTGNSGAPYSLFTTDTSIDAGGFAAASVGVALTRTLDVEARGTYGRPDLTAHVAGDAEGAPAVDASEPVHEFTIAAVARVHPARWRLGSRAGLFASGGAGYLRHLHEGSGYAVDGRLYLAGGGLTYRLGGGSGRLKDAGLRFDGGVLVRAGDPVIEHSAAAPFAGASLYLRF